jgi:hypothetical protein
MAVLILCVGHIVGRSAEFISMVWFEFVWSHEEDGNVAHLAEHGLTPEDFEWVFMNYESEGVSRSTGRPIRFGETPDGRNVCIIFEWLEAEMVVYPVTAFEVEG